MKGIKIPKVPKVAVARPPRVPKPPRPLPIPGGRIKTPSFSSNGTGHWSGK